MDILELRRVYGKDSTDFQSPNDFFSSRAERFLHYIIPKGKILDFGCGSGRDAKYFHDKGFDVDAAEQYNGIWACASFKYGDYEGIKNGRYFTGFMEISFQKFIADTGNVEIKNEIAKHNSELKVFKEQLTNMVPYRALAGFFQKSDETVDRGWCINWRRWTRRCGNETMSENYTKPAIGIIGIHYI